MWRRLGFGVLFLLAAYPVGCLGGVGLVYLLSDNTFDKGVEAPMTGAFVVGPAFAIIGFFIGLARGGRPRESKGA